MTVTAQAKLMPKAKRTKADWCVINPGKGGRLECLRCGGHYLPNYPAPIGVMASLARAFSKDHDRCQLHALGLCCSHCGQRGHEPDACPGLTTSDPVEWLHGTDTGTSSKTIWRVMMGRPSFDGDRDDVPLDPADFGRCHRLLSLFPEWRTRLLEMRSVAGWAPLVDSWEAMVALYEEERPSGEAPKLYALMTRLIYGGGKR